VSRFEPNQPRTAKKQRHGKNPVFTRLCRLID